MYFFKNRAYEPVLKIGDQPIGDSDELAAKGDRLMFSHERKGSRLFVAPKGERSYGFVIGVFIS